MPAGTHPGAAVQVFAHDIYRVSVTPEGAGWAAGLQNELVAIPAGQDATVPVFIGREAAGAASGNVTIRIVSESDPTKFAIVTTAVRR